jgi:hypothetical protein
MDCPLHVFEGRKEAVVDIGQMDDSKTVVRRMKPMKPDLGLGDLRITRERRRDVRLPAAER